MRLRNVSYLPIELILNGPAVDEVVPTHQLAVGDEADVDAADTHHLRSLIARGKVVVIEPPKPAAPKPARK